MTADEFKMIRKRLGFTQAEMAVALRLGEHNRGTVMRWETGRIRVPGPVSVAMEYMDVIGADLEPYKRVNRHMDMLYGPERPKGA